MQEQLLRYMTMSPEGIWPVPDSSNDPQSNVNGDEWSINNGVELPAQIFPAIKSQDRPDPDFVYPSFHPGLSIPQSSSSDAEMSETSSTDGPFDEFDVASDSEKEFLLEALNNGDAPKQDILMFQRARRALDSRFPEPTRYQDATSTRGELTSTRGSAELFGGEGVNTSRLLTIDKWTQNKSHAMLYKVAKLKHDISDEYSKPNSDSSDSLHEPNLNHRVPYKILRTKVESFGRRCMAERRVNSELTAPQWRQYSGAIYYHARKTGMGKHQATTEAMRAKAAYRCPLGLAGGYQLDESDDDLAVKLEVHGAAKYITSMKVDVQDGSIDSALLIPGWDEVGARIRNCAQIEQLLGRTRDAGGTVANTGGGIEVRVEATAGGQAQPRKRKRRKRRKLVAMMKTKAQDNYPTVAIALAAISAKTHRGRSMELELAATRQVDDNFGTKSGCAAGERKRAISDDSSKNQRRKHSILGSAVGGQPYLSITSKVELANEQKRVRKRKRGSVRSRIDEVVGQLNPKGPSEQSQVQSQNPLHSPHRLALPNSSDAGLEKEHGRKEPKEWSATSTQEGHDNGHPNDQQPKKRRRGNKTSTSVNSFTSLSNAEINIKGNEGYAKMRNVVEPVRVVIDSNGKKRKIPQSKIQRDKKRTPLIEGFQGEAEKFFKMATENIEGASERTSLNRKSENKTPGLNKDDLKKRVLEASGETKPLLDVTSMNAKRDLKQRGTYYGGGIKRLPLVGSQGSSSGEPPLDIQNEGQKDSRKKLTIGVGLDLDELKDEKEISTGTSHLPETKCETAIPQFQTRGPTVRIELESRAKLGSSDSLLCIESAAFDKIRPGSASLINKYMSPEKCQSGTKFDTIEVESIVTRSSSKIGLSSPVTLKKYSNIGKATRFSTPVSPELLTCCTNDQPSPTPVESKEVTTIASAKKVAKLPTKSPFFSPPASVGKPKATKESRLQPREGTVSCIPFPPLCARSFGLLQEKLAHDPFRLLIGVTFLNRTVGKHAIPVFFELMEKYPTPADILAADKGDIIKITRHLGLQTIRAEKYIKYAHFWVHDPPVKGRRYRVENYPNPGDGKEIKRCEVLDDDDLRTGAWEIGHMTKGRYAIDSWRIFCRDVFRGEAQGWNGEGRDGGFQPEWMRVQPRDKELVAYLRWMWLKEGFEWDPVTGEKEVASRALMEAAIAGRISWDDRGGLRILNDREEDVGNGAASEHRILPEGES